MKLIRLYKTNQFISNMMKEMNINHITLQTVQALLMMVFLLHMVGCLWATVAVLTTGDQPTTWISKIGLTDSDSID